MNGPVVLCNRPIKWSYPPAVIVLMAPVQYNPLKPSRGVIAIQDCLTMTPFQFYFRKAFSIQIIFSWPEI